MSNATYQPGEKEQLYRMLYSYKDPMPQDEFEMMLARFTQEYGPDNIICRVMLRWHLELIKAQALRQMVRSVQTARHIDATHRSKSHLVDAILFIIRDDD